MRSQKPCQRIKLISAIVFLIILWSLRSNALMVREVTYGARWLSSIPPLSKCLSLFGVEKVCNLKLLAVSEFIEQRKSVRFQLNFFSAICRGTKPYRVQDFLCFITSGFRPTSTKTERSSKKQSHYEGMPRGTWVMESALTCCAGRPGFDSRHQQKQKAIFKLFFFLLE